MRERERRERERERERKREREERVVASQYGELLMTTHASFSCSGNDLTFC